MIKEKNIKNLEERFKIWTEEGIIYIEFIKSIIYEDLDFIFNEIEENLKKFNGNGKILVSLASNYKSIFPSSQTRKEMMSRSNNLLKKIGFDKAAIYGGNLIITTIVSFILTAAQIKNVKFFDTKEKALNWLKK
jgi:hypothetical protein